jgi:hypothetical protein
MNETPHDTRPENIHRGEVVRSFVDKWYGSMERLGKKIGRSRASLYRDFENPEMDWIYILRIGAVIDHDFSEEFPEISMYSESFLREDAAKYLNAKDEVLDRAIKEIDKWKSEAYKNLSEANKWKDMYYELALKTGTLGKAL